MKEEYIQSYIMVDKPMLDESGYSYLPIYYKFPFGKDVNIGDNSSLIRPFRKILKEGKPMGRITFVFYKELDNYYTLGTFVKTGKRLLFFRVLQIQE